MAKNKKHHLEKRGEAWYFIAMVNGNRYREPLSTNLREAKRIRDEYLYELKHYGYLSKETRKQREQQLTEDMLFGEVAMKWVELQEKRVKKGALKSSTLRDYKSSMNLHVLPRFGNTPISDITAGDVEDFALSLECGNTRTNNILVPMRSLFKMAKKREIVRNNIMEDVDNLTREDTDISPLSPSEVCLFLDHTPSHYKPFFTVLFFTGMRFGEIAALKWKNVELERGMISDNYNTRLTTIIFPG
jgi:integrase